LTYVTNHWDRRLGYIGSRTVHADSGTVLNVPLPGPGTIAARRPIPQLSQISDIRWNGWATYHALTLSAKRRLAKGLMFDANWNGPIRSTMLPILA